VAGHFSVELNTRANRSPIQDHKKVLPRTRQGVAIHAEDCSFLILLGYTTRDASK
jgi:hypothetical protein